MTMPFNAHAGSDRTAAQTRIRAAFRIAASDATLRSDDRAWLGFVTPTIEASRARLRVGGRRRDADAARAAEHRILEDCIVGLACLARSRLCAQLRTPVANLAILTSDTGFEGKPVIAEVAMVTGSDWTGASLTAQLVDMIVRGLGVLDLPVIVSTRSAQDVFGPDGDGARWRFVWGCHQAVGHRSS